MSGWNTISQRGAPSKSSETKHLPKCFFEVVGNFHKKQTKHIPGFSFRGERNGGSIESGGLGPFFNQPVEVEDNWSKVENMGNTEVGI